jgi:hypothetical protein
MKNYIVFAMKKGGWTIVGTTNDVGQAVKMLNTSREDGNEAYVADFGKMVSTVPDYVLSEIELDESLGIIPNPINELDS